MHCTYMCSMGSIYSHPRQHMWELSQSKRKLVHSRAFVVDLQKIDFRHLFSFRSHLHRIADKKVMNSNGLEPYNIFFFHFTLPYKSAAILRIGWNESTHPAYQSRFCIINSQIAPKITLFVVYVFPLAVQTFRKLCASWLQWNGWCSKHRQLDTHLIYSWQ